MKLERKTRIKTLSDKLFALAEEAGKLSLWLGNGASVASLLAMVAVELRAQAKSKVLEMPPPKGQK